MLCTRCESDNHLTIEHDREMRIFSILLKCFPRFDADQYVRDVKVLTDINLYRRLEAMRNAFTLYAASTWSILLKAHWQIGVYERQLRDRGLLAAHLCHGKYSTIGTSTKGEF